MFKKPEAPAFERLVLPTLVNNINAAYSRGIMSANHSSLKTPIRYLQLGIWAGINNTLNLASDIRPFDIDTINFVI